MTRALATKKQAPCAVCALGDCARPGTWLELVGCQGSQPLKEGLCSVPHCCRASCGVMGGVHPPEKGLIIVVYVVVCWFKDVLRYLNYFVSGVWLVCVVVGGVTVKWKPMAVGNLLLFGCMLCALLLVFQ